MMTRDRLDPNGSSLFPNWLGSSPPASLEDKPVMSAWRGRCMLAWLRGNCIDHRVGRGDGVLRARHGNGGDRSRLQGGHRRRRGLFRATRPTMPCWESTRAASACRSRRSRPPILWPRGSTGCRDIGSTPQRMTEQETIIGALGVARISTRGWKHAGASTSSPSIRESSLKTYVLGISGGVDSLAAALLAQRAVEELRAAGHEAGFMAVRLPYGVQADESDAQRALDIIKRTRCAGSISSRPPMPCSSRSSGPAWKQAMRAERIFCREYQGASAHDRPICDRLRCPRAGHWH